MQEIETAQVEIDAREAERRRLEQEITSTVLIFPSLKQSKALPVLRYLPINAESLRC